MSSVWFADISMESLPGPRPVRPTVSLRPSMACFRQQSARLVDMHALKPCARSCFSLPENLTSPRSTRMPAEPHYPLSFQKSLTFNRSRTTPEPCHSCAHGDGARNLDKSLGREAPGFVLCCRETCDSFCVI